ncbi:hypothetical protein H4S07_003068 [Coemansia furcata]|uniref:Uncharacterized protein n=1 Tax=Coemansia furcata TaxID=417177 RepID=A0ACC1LIB8_9FUNG|nr:hypothetical protein H4S07_003068 [Coemansia furcata]
MPGRIAAIGKTVHMLIREPNFDANIPGNKIDKVNKYRFDELVSCHTIIQHYKDLKLQLEEIVDDRHVAAAVQQQLMRTRMRMESDDEDGLPKPAVARIAGSSQLSSLTDSVEDMDDGTFSAVAVEKLIVRHRTLLASGKEGVASSLHRTSLLLKRPGTSLLGAAAKQLNVAGDKKVI